MGQLKPNAEYVYERQDGVVYMREKGAVSREAIGWDWEPEDNPARVKGSKIESIRENQLWHDIREHAKTNPTLQAVLDRAIMIYRLSKDKPL